MWNIGQLDAGVELRGTVAVPDGYHGLNPSLARTRNYLFAIGVKLLAIEMCVRIDEHQKSDLRPPPWHLSLRFKMTGQPYLSRAPMGTSSKKLASTGFPPSSDAATIIPFDS